MQWVLELSAGVAVLAAAIAALLYLSQQLRNLLRWGRAVFRKLVSIERLARELEPNHGSSVKDDVHGMAIAVGMLQRSVDDLKQRFDAHLEDRENSQ